MPFDATNGAVRPPWDVEVHQVVDVMNGVKRSQVGEYSPGLLAVTAVKSAKQPCLD
jgi:hypothetical protein